MKDVIFFVVCCLLVYLVYRCGYAKGECDALEWVDKELDDVADRVAKMSSEELKEFITNIHDEKRNSQKD